MKDPVESAVPHLWPKVDVLQLESRRLQRDLRVSIARPHEGGSGDPLLLYVLDPSFNFSTAVAVAAFLGDFARMAGGRWPDMVIAGVGYETSDPREVMARRALDLTPTAHGAPPGVHLPPLSFGGAAAFLAAFHSEVMPAVEARLGSAPSVRVLAGHSFGGLFALYTLLHQPELFNGYLVVSPSLWWDERVVFRYERESRDADRALPVRLFMAVGENEQAPGGGWRNEGFSDEAIQMLRQVQNFHELSAAFKERARHGLRMHSAVIANEYHLTVFPSAFGAGLRWMVDELA